MDHKRYLLLSTKKLAIVIGAFILAMMMHNIIYALFFDYYSRTGGDEQVFFIIAVFVIPLYFLISAGYTMFYHVRGKVKKRG